MNEYMFFYKGGDPDWQTNTPKEEMAAAMEKWGAWMGKLQANGQLVSGGSPLDYGGKNLTKDGVLTDISAAEYKELVTGYSIVTAKDFDEATEIAKSCPIFNHPNITVEIRQVTKMD